MGQVIPGGVRATRVAVNDFEYFWLHWQKHFYYEMNEILSYLDIIKHPNLLSLVTLQDTTDTLDYDLGSQEGPYRERTQ